MFYFHKNTSPFPVFSTKGLCHNKSFCSHSRIALAKLKFVGKMHTVDLEISVIVSRAAESKTVIYALFFYFCLSIHLVRLFMPKYLGNSIPDNSVRHVQKILSHVLRQITCLTLIFIT